MAHGGGAGWRRSGSRAATPGAAVAPIPSHRGRHLTDDRRNFFVFVAIAALILLGWPLAQQKFFPTANPPVSKVVDGKSKPVANPAADPTADGPAAVRDRRLVLAETPRVRIATPRLSGSINLKGARIDDLVLVDYKETIAKNSAPIRLLSPAGAPEAYFAAFGWQGRGLNPPAADAVWTASARELSPGHPVTLDAANASGQRFRIELSVDDSYMFSVRQTVLNAGATPVAVASYGLVNRTGVSKDEATWQSHTGPMSVHGGSADYSLKFKDGRCRPAALRHHRRMARLRRQILADRARPRSGPRLRRPVPRRRQPGLSGRLYQRAGPARTGQGRDPDQPLLRRRQGSENPPGVPGPGRAQARQGDRLGLVRDRREADLPLSRLAVPSGRQFRRRHHPADADHPRADVPDRPAPVSRRWRRCA